MTTPSLQDPMARRGGPRLRQAGGRFAVACLPVKRAAMVSFSHLIVGLGGELPQAAESPAQQIEVGKVPFGFLTHLGEGAPLLDRKLDQMRKLLFERAQGGVYRGDVFGAEVQGYQVLAPRNSPRGGQETQRCRTRV
jgi:hypothetical protein